MSFGISGIKSTVHNREVRLDWNIIVRKVFFGHLHNAMFKALGSRKSLTLYVGVKSKMWTSFFQLLLLYAETKEERDRGKKH